MESKCFQQKNKQANSFSAIHKVTKFEDEENHLGSCTKIPLFSSLFFVSEFLLVLLVPLLLSLVVIKHTTVNVLDDL